jgi:hypothetical protein
MFPVLARVEEGTFPDVSANSPVAVFESEGYPEALV